ncbi:Cytochrome b561 and DOMON domain-containing protein [Rhynchospora pubera]|uniref:Cytochrome b561 and DOMON domain-containing protein n=1 Tax=Rhynchospora pubera TaxID=906938 RepID=A0AAV8FI93_9POAL|nr:Cytochrome b561 and DOMON domain-containing protein [Rhynchospora pubera]
MEASVFSVLFLSLCAFSFSPVRSQTNSTDSCSSNLAVSSLIPFYSSSFNCLSAWSSEGFILRYATTSNNTWSFVLSSPYTNAYIAIGFSSNGQMVGSSAMVGWATSGNGTVGTANQYYLGGVSPSDCPPGTGNLNVVKNSTVIVSQSSRLYLAFEITVDKPSPYLVYAVGPRGTLPSSNGYLTEHRDMASASFNANTGVISDAQSGRGFDKARKHGLLVLLGWGVLVPIGILAARYFKRYDPHWFYSHISIQTVGFGLGLAGIIMGFDLEDDEVDDYDKHKALGIAILVFGCLQVTAFLARPDKSSKVRKYWNWFHHNIGRLAIAFSIANIFLGLSIASEGKSWYIGYGAFLGVWVITALLLEIRHWMKSDD